MIPPSGGTSQAAPTEGGHDGGADLEDLDARFYARPVLTVARDLIGCTLTHGSTSGTIVETEAYHESEPACHAFVGITRRTVTLFGPPGRAYVYRSYGIHALFNAVCEPEGVGAAVLIRALAPTGGIPEMCRRRGTDRRVDLCCGPGRLTQALAIDLCHNAGDLRDGEVRIQRPRGDPGQPREVLASPRVGITKAVDLSWRFSVVGDPNVSRPRPRG